ncbi:unnamed protein product [Symbiodinium necroappetens]|uniref:Uncharacterized protein n=1 Tax=Symbiodinium necroappetens TaxID=1628268 RepID=A0A812WDX6_9DINO|nr:unnamed protein product [Symbiodinium necroappetens]
MGSTLLLIIVSLIAGALGVTTVVLLLRKAPTSLTSVGVTERVRSVGRLVGLEVHAKEIATSTKGWSWMPPILLSQAKIAMIFHFEKQYSVDLARLTDEHVECTGVNQYRVTLPAVEGALRLTDVTPYDIQAGRILGLLDVIQMNAQTQAALMQAAQEQAASLYAENETKYMTEAKRSIERQIASLLGLMNVEVEIVWRESETRMGDMKVAKAVKDQLGMAG